MRRVVITGLGIVSNIGNNAREVDASLRAGRSGIKYSEEYAELGLRSRVHGPVDLNPAEHIDRRIMRFMGDAAAFCYLAAREAIEDAGLEETDVSNPRTGVVLGSGGASNRNFLQAADALRSRGIRGVGPYMVTRTMGSTTSANVATALKIKGVNYSISSACSTSAHCIGHAAELIQFGKQDVMLAGGGEEVDWTMSMLFDGMGALSSRYNDTPEKASRPYDADRDGFVIAGGAGCVVLESLEHAVARGAKIYAELVGYGATSDGADMVAPSGEGAVRCMQLALSTVEGPIDYINAHGTGTQAGDIKELDAVRATFGENIPPIASTKSLTGHALGAAGVNEAIYSLLMMQGNYIAPSVNVDNRDPAAEGMPLVTSLRENVTLRQVMSNSFGFGGTNATLVLRRYD
ncbi:MAG: beta-ketoacyl-ACP synthase I [Gammaproteobacteria bacterium]|jgi:3-oxoacyl-[acyl-carrier-protein] synthase-1|nr:beta-ketoacyl-ACP synthase I [Gammaproteobacteria bacterium]